jgi:putative hydrolase of the HAD superfamily
VSQYVIFDLFHTLVDGADGERNRVVGEMARIVGVEPTDLVQAYHDTWRERLVAWDTEQTVRILAERLGGSPSDEQVGRAAELRRELSRRVLSAVAPGTVQVLDGLRASGWRLGLISNATAESAEAWPASPLATCLDAAIFSCDVGLAKPDRRIYVVGAEALRAVAAQCFYVGDGADDELAGAEAAGMTVIRTTEHNNTVPSWTGPTIGSLGELPALLAEIEASQNCWPVS